MDVSTGTRQGKVKSRRRTATQIRQQRPIHAPAQLSVDLSIPQHVRERLPREWIVQVATKSLLLHTLYSRGVCPAPAVEMLRVHQEHRGTRRPNIIERKFLKFGGSLQNLLEEWTLLCYSVDIQRALITLGPSWSRQRERHVLDFSGLSQDDVVVSTEPGAEHEHALSRRLSRALLDGITDEEGADRLKSLTQPSPSGSSYLVHLSVWITHQMAETLFERCMDNDVRRMSTFQQLLQTLTLRPGYLTSRNANKGKHEPHVVIARIYSSSTDKDNCGWMEENGVWITLPTSLKGFRL